MTALKSGQPGVLVVLSRYHEEIASELLKGAAASLEAAGMEYDLIEAPGALEIPPVIAMAIEAKRFTKWTTEGRYRGAIALGCVIRGETTHYDIVAGESARALMDLSVRHSLPIGNGILTVENEEQALERASVDKLDKGGDAAKACIALIKLRNDLSRND
ncbi:MAG: 6,7-dimethyl-8-ribityllumazine synthase [Hyphomicrobiales bacterium]|nr:6,7-dimethyl-8-ribityllumazine synthase [Hyphomicrobiales bacterium]